MVTDLLLQGSSDAYLAQSVPGDMSLQQTISGDGFIVPRGLITLTEQIIEL